MTYLVYDHLFMCHETGGNHPECPGRLNSIETKFAEKRLFDRCRRLPFTTIEEHAVLRIHSPKQVKSVKDLAQAGGGQLDPDTHVSCRSYDVALHAAGACVALVDAVMKDGSKTALSLIRPPGHHATPDRAMGFCLFNNVALAADHARKKHHLNRIMIIDWDVHHGNGTQDIFYADPHVTFVSIHRYGAGFYPGTGAADETGRGAGLGTTLNVPLKMTTTPEEYRSKFCEAVETAADKCKPELVLISAGFDAHHLDPVGGLGLGEDDFVFMTGKVLEIAKTHSKGRVVSCLEGGYHLQATADCVAAHFETLLASET